ncbi:hypothetical protein LINPERHAP1_LOCUS37476, partial [Linum perenne]
GHLRLRSDRWNLHLEVWFDGKRSWTEEYCSFIFWVIFFTKLSSLLLS